MEMTKKILELKKWVGSLETEITILLQAIEEMLRQSCPTSSPSSGEKMALINATPNQLIGIAVRVGTCDSLVVR